MRALRITHLNAMVAAEIAVLAAQIPDLDLENYIAYLYDYVREVGLFGLFKDTGKLVAFLHAEAGHPVWPNEGYFFVAASQAGLPKPARLSLWNAGEAWLKAQGATHVRIVTERSPRAFERLYGATLTHEYTLRKPL